MAGEGFAKNLKPLLLPTLSESTGLWIGSSQYWTMEDWGVGADAACHSTRMGWSLLSFCPLNPGYEYQSRDCLSQCLSFLSYIIQSKYLPKFAMSVLA